MNRIPLITVLSLLISVTIAQAQTAPSTAPAIPPSGDDAKAALDESPRHGEWVEVVVPGEQTKLRAWVVYPERKEKAPVVIVIHEIFGLTDWVRGVADRLAADGFIAVAPDLLSGKGPSGGGTESFASGDVRAAIQKLAPDEVNKKLDATKDHALAFPAASGKFATVGYCWGGTASFNYAVHQPKLNAAVVYYGTGPRESDAYAKITAPVLGLYGADDARVNTTIESSKAAMEKASKSYTPIVYDGAGHGFLRQQSGRDGANLKAAQQSWAKAVEFLKVNLE